MNPLAIPPRTDARPGHTPRALLALTLAAALAFAAACASSPSPSSPSAATTAAAVNPSGAAPAGLPAGINDSFLDEEMDVSSYVERFEGESRAVYAERVAITRALGLAPGDRIADIGAGTGFFTALFDAAVGPNGKTYAVEISPQFLKHLRDRAEEENLQSVEVVEGTMTSVELPQSSIEIAFICDVYHHFESPEATLASLFEAIRPGGELVLIEFERIPGETPAWLLKHVRAGRDVFQAEIEAAGFVWQDEIQLPGLDDNYIFRFKKPATQSPAP
ncbi:MAG: class I SAM-dependent methyltransferase [Myxococcota bacterium]